jgi:hypothetical protein
MKVTAVRKADEDGKINPFSSLCGYITGRFFQTNNNPRVYFHFALRKISSTETGLSIPPLDMVYTTPFGYNNGNLF